MYTIHFYDDANQAQHFGHVTTMKRAREIVAELTAAGTRAEFFYSVDLDNEFLPGF